MANASLPGTSGFVGEFMVILSSMKENFWVAFCINYTNFGSSLFAMVNKESFLW